MARLGFVTRDGKWAHFDTETAHTWPENADRHTELICSTANTYRFILCRHGLPPYRPGVQPDNREISQKQTMRWFVDRGMEVPWFVDDWLIDTEEEIDTLKHDPDTRQWPPVPPQNHDDIPWDGDPDPDYRCPYTHPDVETLYRFPDGRWIVYDPKPVVPGMNSHKHVEPLEAEKWLTEHGFNLAETPSASSETTGEPPKVEKNDSISKRGKIIAVFHDNPHATLDQIANMVDSNKGYVSRVLGDMRKRFLATDGSEIRRGTKGDDGQIETIA